MSKYLCQDCKNNNNGWCTVRKCNGLKKLNITSCNTFEGKNTIEFVNGSKITTIEGDSSRSKRAELKDNSVAFRVLGQREMLWKIQMQIFAINKDTISTYEDKYKSLVESVKSIGLHLDFEEELWNVNNIVDSMIDDDMIKASKYMTGVF